MKQILQDLKSGNTLLEEVPAPQVKKGSVLIQTTSSLVSLGTERMLVEFGKAGWVEKARQQPDKVKMVLEKIRTEGLLPTVEAVFNKLGQPLPLGYCNVGEVIAVGDGVSEFKIGDRVTSNGPHAEYVAVPKNLVAKIPENVSDEEAAFTVIGSIGLQGIRLCQPTLGEEIVVIGLGLIGLITAQLLKANGCKVIGVDLDENKCKLAENWGIMTINPAKGQDPVRAVLEKTGHVGADGVIITASAKTNEIISQAARMSRKKGRIILVGVTGLNLSRAEFYEKELTFQVSCSYGPGRYDDEYEQKGIDYPLAYVRWTEKRNFEAVLQSISNGTLKVKELISQKVPLEDYNEIYGQISGSGAIASILEYPKKDAQMPVNKVQLEQKHINPTQGILGVIGAGNFSKMTMMPILNKINANVKYVASSTGVTGTSLAKKYGISHSTTNYHDILHDTAVDAVVVTTRHNSHAHFVKEILEADKHVFVEKPLALNEQELDSIIAAYQKSQKSVMVGFNRRFSPHIAAIRNSLGKNTGPVNIVATMNAGFIPSNVWVHDMEVGGGRIIGEACHFLDLCTYLTGSPITAVCMNAMGSNPAMNTDNASILLKFENGSNAVINYFANGSKSYSKERLEVYSQERTWIMDNFRTTKGYGVKGFKNLKTPIDKGHKAQFKEYVNMLKKGNSELIPFNELINVTKASFAAIQSLKENRWVEV